jgi:hypothetical protein
MKNVILGLILVLGVSAQASTSSTSAKSHLSTDVNFEDQLVNGKYAYPDEAIATVEDEKLLDDLLAVRKNFKDRLKESSLRN